MSCRFLLLSAPRTGSSMLQSRLCFLPSAVCFRALFSRQGWPADEHWDVHLFQSLRDKWKSLETRSADAEAFLTELFACYCHFQAVGFKHHCVASDLELTSRLIGMVDKVIILRRNPLAAFSSDLLVEKTGQGAARVGRDVVVPTKVWFDAERFEAYRRRRQARYDRVRQLVLAKGRPLAIDYIEARRETGVKRICRFLGVDYCFSSSLSLKRHSDDIVSRFENADVAYDYLQRTRRLTWAKER